MTNAFFKNTLAFAVVSTLTTLANANQEVIESEKNSDHSKMEKIVLTAEDQVKQSFGVSVITEKELEELPVVNDVSEYIRRMPGVNLTGNSATGQRGNNRQIDIRGMGPENTLILIDGKPVNSRNSVRYGWRGERDTRGDSNWVPADAIESIEVLRGPAAARYGSGAMGGVVNIKTKKVTNEVHGTFEVFANYPESSKEGQSHRESFNLSGPMIKDVLGYRIYGNYNKTKGDAADINPIQENGTRAAGREGVENKDIAGRLAWQINDVQSLTFDISYSRQGNDYAGDTQNSSSDASNAESSALLNSLIGEETNTMYRDGYALTHDADWGWGTTKIIAQYDKTKNKRLAESLAGSGEGSINALEKNVNTLETTRFMAETSIPFTWGVAQVLTVGGEWSEDKFTDPANTKQGVGGFGDLLASGDRTKMKSRIGAIFVEDNLQLTDTTDVVVGVRFDDHNKSGSNWGPNLNITQKVGDYWTIKGGIARAYKAPNMYQSSEGYLLNTSGNGCPLQEPRLTRCVLQGNGDLKPETSVNKEFGVQFEKDIVNASLGWFRNDYKNKIVAGIDPVVLDNVPGQTRPYNVLRWSNTPKALIEGFEGSISLDWGDITWTNNFTYMMKSEDKRTGNPLSIVPKYTINSIFHYQITDALDTNFIYTQYGRQKPRQNAESNTESGNLNTESVKSYGLAGINFGYKFTSNITGRLGISNLFDEKLERDKSTNQTYNEPGRAYYVNLKYSF